MKKLQLSTHLQDDAEAKEEDTIRSKCAVPAPIDFEGVRKALEGDVRVPLKQSVSYLSPKGSSLCDCPVEKLFTLPSLFLNFSSNRRAQAAKKAKKQHLKAQGEKNTTGVWQSFNLKEMGVPREAWPSSTCKGTKGYTVVCPISNAVPVQQ